MILKSILIILCISMIIGAIVAVNHKNMTVAVVLSGLVSLFASVAFLIFAAPDVAMTEAAIGSGLTTVIFFYVLNRIKKEK